MVIPIFDTRNQFFRRANEIRTINGQDEGKRLSPNKEALDAHHTGFCELTEKPQDD